MIDFDSITRIVMAHRRDPVARARTIKVLLYKVPTIDFMKDLVHFCEGLFEPSRNTLVAGTPYPPVRVPHYSVTTSRLSEHYPAELDLAESGALILENFELFDMEAISLLKIELEARESRVRLQLPPRLLIAIVPPASMHDDNAIERTQLFEWDIQIESTQQ